MSFRCGEHGWSHLLNPCPSCGTFSAASGTGPDALIGVTASSYQALQARMKELEAYVVRDAKAIKHYQDECNKLREIIKSGHENTVRLLNKSDQEILALQKVVDAARELLQGTPTDSSGDYDWINQPGERKLQLALRKLDGEKK